MVLLAEQPVVRHDELLVVGFERFPQLCVGNGVRLLHPVDLVNLLVEPLSDKQLASSRVPKDLQ